MTFMEPAELKGAEVDVPETIIDLFKPDILPSTDTGDIDPVGIPAYAAVGGDLADLETVRVFQWRQFCGHLPC